jgi:hypothetical protein
MERMNNNDGTLDNGSSFNNDKNLDNGYNIRYGNTPEIEEPNPSIATPSIPDEMPISEVK